MEELLKLMEESLDEFNKTMEICKYAESLSKPQFNVLMSMLFDKYVTAHEDYNLLNESASIVTSVYEVLGRDPHDDDTRL